MTKNLSFKQRLKQIGLSDNEANVYLCVLEKGRTTPKEVAKETSLNHTTAYRVLKYLVDKDLISMAKEGEKKLFFSIEDPDRIRDLLKEKRQELKAQEEYLDDLMPSLKAVYKGHKHLKIDFFEGKEGVHWIQKHVGKIATEKDEIYEIVPIDYVKKNFPLKKDDPRKKLQDVRSFTVYTSKEGEIMKRPNCVFLDPKYLHSKIELVVTGDATIINTLDGEIGGILIQDKQVSSFFKELIRLVYKLLLTKKK